MDSLAIQKNSLRGKLTSNNYLKVSYPLLLKFDAATAVFVTLLVHMEVYNEEQKQVDADGFFMIKRDYVEDKIGFTKKIQMRITTDLVEKGLIQYKKKGIPQTGWIKINHSVINLLLDNCKF